MEVPAADLVDENRGQHPGCAGASSRWLDYATALKHRTGDNPRVEGHLDNLLPKPTRGRKDEHHAGFAHAEIAAFHAGNCGLSEV
jgi:hypothetical protein